MLASKGIHESTSGFLVKEKGTLNQPSAIENVYLYFDEESSCPNDENNSCAAATNNVLLNSGRKELHSQVSKSATRIQEFCSKRKLGPIVGTTSIEANETENRIKTLLSPHKQKIFRKWVVGLTDGEDANISGNLPLRYLQQFLARKGKLRGGQPCFL